MRASHSEQISGEILTGLAVGIVLLTLQNERLHVLGLVSDQGLRLPYGRIGRREPLRRAAERILREQSGFCVDFLEQLYTFGNTIPERGERLIEVCYYGLVPADSGKPDSSMHLRWLNESQFGELPELQARIVQRAVHRLRGKLAYTAVGFELLPAEFTLAELQHLYETILERRLDKRNFRRRIAELGIVSATGGERLAARGRPAALYSFRPEVFQRLELRGDILAF